MSIILLSILAYGLSLAFGIAGLFNNKKLMWIVFIAAIISHGTYSYLQKKEEPPNHQYFDNAFTKQTDVILDEIRINRTLDLTNIKTIIEKKASTSMSIWHILKKDHL